MSRFTKQKFKLLKSFISKDLNYRRNIQGLHFDKKAKAAVATDGYCLAIVSEIFNEDLKGLTIDLETMETINLEFPNWQKIMPTTNIDTSLKLEFTSTISRPQKGENLALVKMGNIFTFAPPKLVKEAEILGLYDATFIKKIPKTMNWRINYRIGNHKPLEIVHSDPAHELDICTIVIMPVVKNKK